MNRAIVFVFVSITATRGWLWSEVKAHLSSFEIYIRCTVFETGITAMVLCAFISSTLTDPGPTFAV